MDGKIGMICSGGKTQIRGIRRLGSNWARTESYLDRMDIIFTSPLFRRSLKKDQKLTQMAAGIYAGISKDNLQKKAALFKYIDDKKLPPGWVGIIAPGNGNNCVLSIANLSNDEATGIIKVHWDGWAPVLSKPSVIKADWSELRVKLKPFETYGEKGMLFIRGEDDKPIEVKRLGQSSYELIPFEGKSSIVHLRWQGPERKELIYKKGKTIEKIAMDSLISITGQVFKINEKTTIVLD